MIHALAWLLIILAVIDWFATVTLVRAALHLHEPALDERATASAILSLGATGGAILGGFVLLDQPIPDGLFLLFLAAGFIALSIPQLVWAVAYWVGRFR